MSARIEEFLARLYVEDKALDAFLADPHGEAARYGLTDGECTATARLDPADLRFAAEGFRRKRARGRMPA